MTLLFLVSETEMFLLFVATISSLGSINRALNVSVLLLDLTVLGVYKINN